MIRVSYMNIHLYTVVDKKNRKRPVSDLLNSTIQESFTDILDSNGPINFWYGSFFLNVRPATTQPSSPRRVGVTSCL